MSRYSFQGTCRDGNGHVIESMSVAVKLAGTSTDATIYAASAGGSPVSASTVTTDSNGHYLFYLDDSDYPIHSQPLDLTFSKSGHNTITYSDVR